MAEEYPKYPAFDRLADEILLGKRVVPFPPGLFAVIAAFMLTLIAGTALSSVALPVLFAPWTSHPAVALFGLPVVLLSVVVPMILLANGFPAGCVSLIAVIRGWLIASLLALLLLGHAAERPALVVLAVATAMLGAAAWITSTTPFAALAVLKQRLRVRRQILMAERSARSQSAAGDQ